MGVKSAEFYAEHKPFKKLQKSSSLKSYTQKTKTLNE